ncbi:hypothetical protein VTN00DRAFT_7193 [Thermoascus crustaceus]|uniref:uncharacterized protein n=1 Tax=Thermoascus crustaceus TaxID=5088 RepID=UPI0037449CCD
MPPSPPSSTHSTVEAGSAPPSPATSMTSTHTDTDTMRAENALDDIFGSSPPRETLPHIAVPHGEVEEGATVTEFSAAAEPSDLPTLRRQHVTAGYRDGVSFSKGQHVQRGFDAGFPVGAQLGMRVGTVLGILEGVLRGLETRSPSASAGAVKKQQPRGTVTAESPDVIEARRKKREQVKSLYLAAVKELSVEAVFGGVDGSTSSSAAAAAEAGYEDNPEKQLGRKGDLVVSKWEKRVMVPSWEENMEALEEEEIQGEQS